MHDYKINDEVAVYYAGKFHKRDHVAAVKEYKRGTKITLAGGAIFDQHGQAWGDSYAPEHAARIAEVVGTLRGVYALTDAALRIPSVAERAASK